jgi:DNA-binding transcriptional ArsR family regulator
MTVEQRPGDLPKRAPVLDVGRPEAVAVEVDASEAADVLMSLFAVYSSHDDDTFDAGRARLAAIRAGVDPDLDARIDDLLQGNEKVPAHLLGLVWETPRPRTLAAFVERVREADPLEVHLHLLGYYAAGRQHVEEEIALRAARGDAEAIAETVAALAEWPQTCRTVEHLLRLGATAVKERLLDVLPRWHEEVYLPNADGIAAALERDAAAKRELARSNTPEQLTELATQGYQYAPAPGIRRLVFFPGYWQRPWVLLNEHEHVKVFCYPLPLEGSGDGPSPAELARLFKALGDEGRLRLLKRVSEGPLTLAAAAKELGVAKSTAHHHLALLRHAGLVVMRDDGEDKVYTLRREALPQAGGLLQSYLG